MSDALVMYYSGTGNTRRALGFVETSLKAAGWSVSHHDLAKGLPARERLEAAGLLVFGFPALGFSAPAPALRALRDLPRLEGRKAAVLCACGATWIKGRILPGWAGGAVPEAAALLRRKGLEVLATGEASYPENWRQVSRPAAGAEREALIARGDADAAAFAAALSASLADGGPRLLVRSALVRVPMALVARVFRNLARRVLARLYVADADCTGCGLCARGCPSSAIRMRDARPEWTTECSGCNRCINACPARAVQTSRLRLLLVGLPNLLAMLAAFPLAGGLVSLIASAAGADGAAGSALAAVAPWRPLLVPLASFLLYALFTLLQVGPLDALLRAAERSRLLGPAFAKSLTKAFPTHLAPGFESEARGGPRN